MYYFFIDFIISNKVSSAAERTRHWLDNTSTCPHKDVWTGACVAKPTSSTTCNWWWLCLLFVASINVSIAWWFFGEPMLYQSVFFCVWLICMVSKMCFKCDSSIKTINWVLKSLLKTLAFLKLLFKTLNTSLLKVFMLKLVVFPTRLDWNPTVSSISVRSWEKSSWFLLRILLFWVRRCFPFGFCSL